MQNMILFIEWKSFGNPYLTEAFQRLGYQVKNYLLDSEAVDTRSDTAYAEKLVHEILNHSYCFVFSFNYFPIVAIACKACRIPYVSWTFDCPFIQLYSKTLAYETNFAFVFDKGACEDLAQKGMRAYYLPLAVPVDCYRKFLQDKKGGEPYRADISFVGSLYNEPHGNLFRHMEKLPPYEKGYVEGLIAAQKNIYGYNFLEEILKENPEVVKNILQACPVTADGDGLETVEWILANYFLARRVTALERREILEMLGNEFEIQLYTPGNTQIKGVRNHGKADYYREAPYVFANSKINLNITLRSIQTGIPLRAFDIMGCGGFLLTNYQEDYLEYFQPDKDLVIYNDYEDLRDKVSFYLKHETERKRIAENARSKVAAEHTYLHRAKTILSKVREYWT